ncbi:MAG: cmpR 2 [Akkermansiaceae bacterium]|nr:cmpR 2 [Akkermansiaceae bacterium]
MSEDFDIRLLRVFASLAQTGSHTRTAALMNVTQSAVSHGMKRLEQQAGCALFHKRGKTSYVTPDGRLFLAKVQHVFEALKEAAAVVDGGLSDAKGKLSIVFTSSIAHMILAPVLREFRDCYPKISVVVRFEDTPQAVKEIEEGRSDVAIVIEDQSFRSLTAHPLFEDELHFLFSPMHPWAGRQRLTAAKLSSEHFLLYRKSSVTFQRIEDFFLKQGVMLSSYVEVPDFEIMKQLARLGLGVAVMAPWAAQKELEEGSLMSMPLPKHRIKRRWVVVHQNGRTLRPPEQTFVGLCQIACEQMGAETIGS